MVVFGERKIKTKQMGSQKSYLLSGRNLEAVRAVAQPLKGFLVVEMLRAQLRGSVNIGNIDIIAIAFYFSCPIWGMFLSF